MLCFVVLFCFVFFSLSGSRAFSSLFYVEILSPLQPLWVFPSPWEQGEQSPSYADRGNLTPPVLGPGDGGYRMITQATQASLEGIRVLGLGWKLVCNLGASRSRLLGQSKREAPRGAWVSSHAGPRQLAKPHCWPRWPQSGPPSALRHSAFTATVSWLSSVLAAGLPSPRGAHSVFPLFMVM